jgi:response regulator RpfG family c-di-GMP phosphodiesterase
VRLLLVDDDPGLRMLLRTTFESFDVAVDEAASAFEAEERVREALPDVIVLDLLMPGINGLDLCRRLKSDPATSGIGVVLLTGSDVDADAVWHSRADALVTKPFSPLELLSVVERLAGGLAGVPTRNGADAPAEQLLLYANDLRHLLEVERGQRALIETAYRDTVAALAAALEAKDTGTRAHSNRVQRYAKVLADALDPTLAGDTSAEYGYLLHDVGKIGIPDRILLKPGRLTKAERRVVETHTILGEQMLRGVRFLQGEGVSIVRSHHERWDGRGYPDGLRRDEIPLGALVFSLADTLDAMTSDRPYRRALPWKDARDEILAQSGLQFSPDVVDAYREREDELLRVRAKLAV